ncbi:MAG: branched-chain amino acid ABC transporter permease [Thermoleophilaceae bacterium]|nr:branched-chain amino acid ABC transporter permease [Thermoleophilaceae bacterium]
MSKLGELRGQKWAAWLPPVVVVVAVFLFPLFREPLDETVSDATVTLAYVVFALGLNIVVGFAGLLDLGYVAFFAFGALVSGWLASDHFTGIGGDSGIDFGVSEFAAGLPGIHLNFLLLVIAAILVCAVVGAIIGLPTLRLRGDYIAIVTLAFGEIIGRIAQNGDDLAINNYAFSNGRESISPIDQLNFPIVGEFDSATNVRPYFWAALALVLVVLFVNIRLRDSRLGRAWVALREDEVAAASMGVPLVKTKLMAYAVGAGFGGISGVFLGVFFNSVNANQFLFGFSILILAMVIMGGLGSIWGVVIGATILAYANNNLLPTLDRSFVSDALTDVGLDFTFSQINFGIFGFILLLMMVLRPQGILPERRRQMELAEGIGADQSLKEAKA